MIQMQHDIQQDGYPTMVYTSSKACIYIKVKHDIIHMVQKEIPQESTRKGNKPQVPPASTQK
jgi:hypothetical protein